MFFDKYKISIDVNTKLIGSLIIITLIVMYFLYRSYRLSKEGVFTICQVDHFEAADSGGSLYIDIFYQDKKYRVVADALCGSCNSKYFFVKIIENEPNGVVIFMDDYPVPDCILNSPIPTEGWKIIPTCD